LQFSFEPNGGLREQVINEETISMAAKDDNQALVNRVQELENLLGLGQKRELAQAAIAAAEARAKSLQLPENPKTVALASTISALASRNNVVIAWTAKELQTAEALAAQVSCCCCCCCCVVIANW
jgi:hypothetical protein